ncbi:glycosyltransferase [Dokdonella sp.]|uniref:glycosyltransferase n=1 Tax=Dokdonella sp. TaxID=2291710 RepID=UPI0025BF6C1B|nr:glycosyltransferase [Dokdonella sp.]MBX3689717.1 glycosyltransferase [Dokdonella sp.]
MPAASDPSRTTQGIPRRPLRVCLHGAALTPQQREHLRARLPAAARVVVVGDRVGDWPDAQHLALAADTDPLALLAAAASRFPGEDLVLLHADLLLPEWAIERLLKVLDLPQVLGAFPLDRTPLRNPLPSCAAGADALRIDATCFAWSRRAAFDDRSYPADLPALSAWHGPRLQALGAAALRQRDMLDAAGLRVVVLDHLYIDAGTEATRNTSASDPRDPLPPSPLAALHAPLARALAAAGTPPLAALDHRPVLLHILHGWGGGAQRWVSDYAHADHSAHHLVLIARGSAARRTHGEWLELRDARLDMPPLRRWPLPRPIADSAVGDACYRMLLREVIADHGVDAIIVSSLIGHSLDALRSGLTTLCVVHDHYPLWPRLHHDFGDPALAFDSAQRARELRGPDDEAMFANRDPAHWQALRDTFVADLRAARASLLAPSRSALANQLRLAPELASLPSQVIGHGIAPWPAGTQALPAPPKRGKLRLVMIGRVRAGKGLRLLNAAWPRLREHAELFLLGAGADAHELFGLADLHVLLDYRRDELPALLARLQADAALLLPTVAETFSYTLSELRSLGVPVIATRVGALAERIDDGVDGFLVAADADALVARIIALAADRDALARVRSRLASLDEPTSAERARAYGALLALDEREALRYPLIDLDPAQLEAADSASELAQAQAARRDVSTLLTAAQAEGARRGDWGHALARELRDTQSTLEDRTRWALGLDAQLQDIKPRYEQMLASDSWRITAPLRRAKSRLRNLRATLAFRSKSLRALLARTRGSLAQRGLAGTLARIGQELRQRGGGPKVALAALPHDDGMPFAVPGSEQPRVSIVIPVYNKIEYTIACLRSLAAHAGAVAFEVIVVDDSSSDTTPQRLASVEGIRVQRNAANLGFIGSCNAGAASARGEYVLFLNNDTVVTAGWLESLVACFESAPDAGLVGARLVYPDGRLQEAGGIVFSDASGWNYGRFEDPADPRYGFRREVDYCSGAAILLRRDLFTRLGGFDTRYAPAYYEDTDLAFAVRAAGLKVYVEPASTVIHFEGITSGTDTSSGTKRYQVINRDKFADKWRDALARQPAPGTPIGLAATHRTRHRVLIVDATTPMPDHDSGSLRMVNLMRVLGDLGCRVSFLSENRLHVDRYTPALQALGVEALYAPFVQDPVKFLRERGAEFDLVILSRHYVAAPLAGLVRLYAPKARLVFDTVDLHYLREQRAAELSGDAALARTAAATRTQELKLIRDSDITLVVSPVEQELLARDAPGARVEVLSNVHEVHGCKQGFGARKDLVFVGGFQHPPNVDAVEWFAREVFDTIRTQLPEVRFHVIGSRVPASIRALADDRVIVHGFVEDIMPFMDGCRISVAPLRYGAGVKGKVNMAMSCGLPVVATPIAVEGMHVRIGEDVLVAESASAFAGEILRLYHDAALWDTLSRNGLANVEHHFSFAAARAAVERLFTDSHQSRT